MRVSYNKNFTKKFNNLQKNNKIAARVAIATFKNDLETGVSTPYLRRHDLDGEWIGYSSISAGGDLRLHYKQKGNDIVFVEVGSHSQLYG
ncbi:MAG: type II toxin-antitoxin system mRNA interferase toxin, RelE/StbE family [Defluviitaleaceae bacterium]|nr:type II toxin-antitoxin system mRNA interferase toxin, RelE/StbE family [Defluviitaleaceae bacterium]